MEIKFADCYLYDFEDLNPGDVYTLNNETPMHVYIKLCHRDTRYNSVDLNTGEMYETVGKTRVLLYNATLLLDREES